MEVMVEYSGGVGWVVGDWKELGAFGGGEMVEMVAGINGGVWLAMAGRGERSCSTGAG